MGRSGRGAAALLASIVVVFAVLGLAAPAGAFDITPPSLTIQAGDSTTGTISGLPIATDGTPSCIEAASGTSIYLSASFSTPCGSQAGWSTGMTVRTIPATPAGAYTIVFQVCPTPSCSLGEVRTVPPIDSRSWMVQVTAGPVPVETTTTFPPQPGPTTAPAPAATTPVPAAGTPAPAATRRTTSTPSATPLKTSPSPPATPSVTSPAIAPSSVAAGPPSLVLDHPTVAPGGTLKVSGAGCAPGAEAVVGLPGSVTQTVTAGADGTFSVALQVPSSLTAGRYPVVADCGQRLSTVVDVQTKRGISTVLLLVVAGVVILVAGVVVGRLTRRTP